MVSFSAALIEGETYITSYAIPSQENSEAFPDPMRLATMLLSLLFAEDRQHAWMRFIIIRAGVSNPSLSTKMLEIDTYSSATDGWNEATIVC